MKRSGVRHKPILLSQAGKLCADNKKWDSINGMGLSAQASRDASELSPVVSCRGFALMGEGVLG